MFERYGGTVREKSLGYYGENLAAQYLLSKGYEIVKQNYTIRGGEIDIIAKQASIVVFIEVKTRTSDTFGSGEESVNFWKKKRLKKAVSHFLNRQYFDIDYRVDLLEVKLNPSGILKKINHFEDIEL